MSDPVEPRAHEARSQPPPGVSARLDTTFRISVALKGLDGLLEVVGGVLLLFVTPTSLQRMARTLTQHELSEDPHDFFARHVLQSAATASHTATTFGAIYLLSHGLAKLVLVAAVLRRQTWAYPGMIVLLVVFIVYQLYRLAIRFTVGLTLLTAFDAFVVWLTWKEWDASRSLPPH